MRHEVAVDPPRRRGHVVGRGEEVAGLEVGVVELAGAVDEGRVAPLGHVGEDRPDAGGAGVVAEEVARVEAEAVPKPLDRLRAAGFVEGDRGNQRVVGHRSRTVGRGRG